MMRAASAAALVLAAACGPGDGPGSLTVVSWGGAYARAVTQAHYEPFEAATGTRVAREDYNGGLAEIRTQVDTATCTGTSWTSRCSTRRADATKGSSN